LASFLNYVFMYIHGWIYDSDQWRVCVSTYLQTYIYQNLEHVFLQAKDGGGGGLGQGGGTRRHAPGLARRVGHAEEGQRKTVGDRRQLYSKRQ
jgi:hypothetical protein